MASTFPTYGNETRPLVPRARVRAWTTTRAGEPLLLLALITLALIAHGFNMFHYPSFTLKDDEGIYVSQAWSVLRQGQLAPYTYWYDHAPAGWLFMSGWMALTGGPHTFGGAIDSGRVFMMVLHLASVPLLYHITRKLSRNVAAAALATILFSLSPLAVYYQRLVLLDNIMIFWVLLSLDLMLDGWGRLSRLVLSGVCLGLALVTKESAVFLVPVMLLIAFQQRWHHQGKFAISSWLLPMLMVVSWYPLYALLKGELFPEGAAIIGRSGNTGSNVSLIEALVWQSKRSGGGMLNLNNDFWQLVRNNWIPRDPILFLGGVGAMFINLFWGLRNRRALIAGLLGLLPLLYIGRGGIVFDFYMLAAIPFLCLNLAMVVTPVLRRITNPYAAGGVVALLALVLWGAYWQTGRVQPLYREYPDQAGREALSWIKQHVPADSKMIIRDDLWTDLHEPGLGGPAFTHAHSYTKAGEDPAIRDGVFNADWRNVDYLVVSAGLAEVFRETNNTLSLQAIENAHLVKRWMSDPGSEQFHGYQIVELWKVDKPGTTERAVLQDSNAYIAQRFEQNGAYMEGDGTVTSEAQSYAMLRAVWSNDRTSFNQAWQWTQTHLLDERGLLAWQWRDGAVTDANSATDANTDVALALLMAGEHWKEPALIDAGKRMVSAIWEHEVTTVNNVPYITAGNWATQGPVVALNPSYFTPYAYRIFQVVDPDHDWYGVIDSGYEVLFEASKSPLGAGGSAGLPPDWVGLERATGKLVPLQLEQNDTTRYSYDAARTYWRVALDLRWSNDGRADAYLQQAGFLRDEVTRLLEDGVTRKGVVSAVYARDGSVLEEKPSMVGNAGAVGALLKLDPDAAHTVYAAQVVGGINQASEGVYWGDPNNLYTQEWGWFATALYADALPNLWWEAR